MHHLGRLAVALGQVGADEGMHALGFLVHGLADVME